MDATPFCAVLDRQPGNRALGRHRRLSPAAVTARNARPPSP